MVPLSLQNLSEMQPQSFHTGYVYNSFVQIVNDRVDYNRTSRPSSSISATCFIAQLLFNPPRLLRCKLVHPVMLGSTSVNSKSERLATSANAAWLKKLRIWLGWKNWTTSTAAGWSKILSPGDPQRAQGLGNQIIHLIVVQCFNPNNNDIDNFQL